MKCVDTGTTGFDCCLSHLDEASPIRDLAHRAEAIVGQIFGLRSVALSDDIQAMPVVEG